jgi:hypothetical protein
MLWEVTHTDECRKRLVAYDCLNQLPLPRPAFWGPPVSNKAAHSCLAAIAVTVRKVR